MKYSLKRNADYCLNYALNAINHENKNIKKENNSDNNLRDCLPGRRKKFFSGNRLPEIAKTVKRMLKSRRLKKITEKNRKFFYY